MSCEDEASANDAFCGAKKESQQILLSFPRRLYFCLSLCARSSDDEELRRLLLFCSSSEFVILAALASQLRLVKLKQKQKQTLLLLFFAFDAS